PAPSTTCAYTTLFRSEGQEGTLAEPNLDGVAVSSAREAGQKHGVRQRLHLHTWYAHGHDLREAPRNADRPPTYRFLGGRVRPLVDRKSTRLNSSHGSIGSAPGTLIRGHAARLLAPRAHRHPGRGRAGRRPP